MSDPTVTVKQGVLRGVQTESRLGGSYISFGGIPYAAPPVGDLRFRDPQPPKPWTGVRDASTDGSKCAQKDILTKKFVGDDDCLYLNVATTSLTGSRPVMVWIHGGGFILGDGGSDSYSPDYLVGSDIVYVGINYRLGVLGFLNLDHEVAPGNMGLKDQVAALKWVKENIAQFGGDPNNVTIFGESAGAASVHYLLLSPLANGLFHKAIAQSGVALNPWAQNPETVSVARRYVATLGRDTTDPEEIVEYLRTIPSQRLIEVQEFVATQKERVAPFGHSSDNVKVCQVQLCDGMGCDIQSKKTKPVFPFGPSVDDKSYEPFMPRSPEELIAEGSDVPFIIGHNSHEGILFLNEQFGPLERLDEAHANFNESFETTIPRDLSAKSPSKVPEILRVIKKFYFGDRRITSDRFDEYVQYWGDLFFVLGIHRVVEILRTKKSPTYFYRFSYDSSDPGSTEYSQAPVRGTSHAVELQYLFVAPPFSDPINIEPGSTEAIVRDRFVRMWTDFAKTGNPTPSTDELITERWEPVSRTTKNYLEIGAELSSGVNPDKDMWDTWKRIYAMVDDQ